MKVTVNEGHEQAIEQAQKTLAINMANGHHPFQMLEQFNIKNRGRASVYAYQFLIATVRIHMLQNQRDYDACQLDILENAKPMWDFAEANLSGRFFITMDIERKLSSFGYNLGLTLRLENQDDADQIGVMMKLGGVSDRIDLKYQ
jgi:hypothetical protein